MPFSPFAASGLGMMPTSSGFDKNSSQQASNLNASEF
jgi:hypothetical protein